MKSRQTTKGRNSKKSDRPKGRFMMDGGDSPHRGGCVHNFPHVSEYYQVARGNPATAANLVVGLKPWAQAAVLGHRVIPGQVAHA